MSKIKRKISRRMATAIFDYNLINKGDRVLVAVSGGKDSMTLLHHLMLQQKGLPFSFHIKAIHIQTDVNKDENKSKVEYLLKKWGVDYEILNISVLKRLKPEKKMNCYWCSTQRRHELLKYAQKHNFNKIAFGHHMDDILETFFMNMIFKAELSTMMPAMQYEKYPQKIIRPLALVKEHEIIEFIEELGISRLVCTCDYGENSKRRAMRDTISKLVEEHGDIRDNIFKAMGNILTDYLPRPVKKD